MGAAETDEEVWASVDRAEEISPGQGLEPETPKVNRGTVLKYFYIATIAIINGCIFF